MWGSGGVDKLTLAFEVAVGRAERGGGGMHGRINELLQSLTWSRAWLAVLNDLRRPRTSWRGPDSGS